MTERICLERSGIAPSATEKNTANTTIWRISFCAIASAIEVGIRWVRNFSIENADTGRPVVCALSGKVPGKLAPGCSRLTITRPSSSDTSDALTNQPRVLAKMRPSLAPPPIWAMPPTSVANTSGAMIILIRRRNSIAIRLISAAISPRLSGRKLKISVPMMMPSTIAARIYCVNLLDIVLTPVSPVHRLRRSVADLKRDATRFARAGGVPQCSRCETKVQSVACTQRTMDGGARFLRDDCLNNHHGRFALNDPHHEKNALAAAGCSRPGIGNASIRTGADRRAARGHQ